MTREGKEENNENKKTDELFDIIRVVGRKWLYIYIVILLWFIK